LFSFHIFDNPTNNSLCTCSFTEEKNCAFCSYQKQQVSQVSTVMIATAGITADASINQSYSPGGANVPAHGF